MHLVITSNLQSTNALKWGHRLVGVVNQSAKYNGSHLLLYPNIYLGNKVLGSAYFNLTKTKQSVVKVQSPLYYVVAKYY